MDLQSMKPQRRAFPLGCTGLSLTHEQVGASVLVKESGVCQYTEVLNLSENLKDLSRNGRDFEQIYSTSIAQAVQS